MNRRMFLQSAAAMAAATGARQTFALQGLGTSLGKAPDLVPNRRNTADLWMLGEATRMGWFQLRFGDAMTDPATFVQGAVELHMNAICVTFGGSYAFYPSAVEFHEWAPGISAQNDFMGNLVSEARKHHMRVGARFDFMKQSATTVKAHPEWFITHADGLHSADSSGRYVPCINGDFYHVQAVKIIEEVMTRYKPDSVFFNNFGNNLFGEPEPCQCVNCRRAFQEATGGQELPLRMSEEVRVFLRRSSFRTASLFQQAVFNVSPETILVNADSTPTDGWHSESRMAIPPTPVWGYTTSEAVNRQRTSYPWAVTHNNVTGYSTNFSRLALMPGPEAKLRLRQAMAQGAPLVYAFTGTSLQNDHRDVNAVKEVFAWNAKHAQYFGGQINAAKVLILTKPEIEPRRRDQMAQQSMRGIYRILTENHIPVVVSESNETISDASRKFDLVIACSGAQTAALEHYVREGGRVIYVNEAPSFGIPRPIRTWQLSRAAYAEVRDKKRLSSLKDIEYVLMSPSAPYSVSDLFENSPSAKPTFVEYPAEPDTPLSFVPPTLEHPSEVAQSDLTHTNTPALLFRQVDAGEFAYFPWDVGAMYDHQGMPIHADLVVDVVDALQSHGRQIVTDAHSSVEMVLMHRPKNAQTLLHLIDTSGQTQNSYADPVPMPAMRIEVAGQYSHAFAVDQELELPVTFNQGRTIFTVPSLKEYELVCLS